MSSEAGAFKKGAKKLKSEKKWKNKKVDTIYIISL